MKNSFNKTSMLYWFSVIKDLGIPVPKTEIIQFPNPSNVISILDGDFSELLAIEKEISEKAKKMGFPLFMRTDLFSGKHYWKRTCYIDTETRIKENICTLIDHSFCCDCDVNAIVLREFVPMQTLFTAFHGEMPVNPEYRYFIRNGKVQCEHWYWFQKAIQDGTSEKNLPINWKDELRKAQEIPHKPCTDYANRVASALRGYWSVDFCLAKDGRWILIDMAEGDVSWHQACNANMGGAKNVKT